MQPLLRGTVGATGALVIFAVGTFIVTNTLTAAAKAAIHFRQVDSQRNDPARILADLYPLNTARYMLSSCPFLQVFYDCRERQQ